MEEFPIISRIAILLTLILTALFLEKGIRKILSYFLDTWIQEKKAAQEMAKAREQQALDNTYNDTVTEISAKEVAKERARQEREIQEWIQKTEEQRIAKEIEGYSKLKKAKENKASSIIGKTEAKSKKDEELKALEEFEELYYYEYSRQNEANIVDVSLWAEYDKMIGLHFSHERSQGSTKNISWVSPSLKFINRNSKNGFKYYSLLDYFPKRYDRVPLEVENNRQLIYHFKDGNNSQEIAKIVASAIYAEFSKEFHGWSDGNTVFSIIPASTKAKTYARYLAFCNLVSQYLGIRNGYSSIEVSYDREALKGTIGGDKTSNLIYNPLVFTGRHVILFDDVKTSGGSFVQNACKLKVLGAKDVTGVFLGETYDSYSRGEPVWIVNTISSNFIIDNVDNDLPF